MLRGGERPGQIPEGMFGNVDARLPIFPTGRFERVPVFVFLGGLMLELVAAYVATFYLKRPYNTVDELMSLTATGVMCAGTLMYLRAFRAVSWDAAVASSLVIISKALDLVRETRAFNEVPLIGIEDSRSVSFKAVIFAAGGALIIIALFRAVRTIALANWKLERQNQILTREQQERERAAAALRESEAMLLLVIESIPEAVWWKDRESRYLGANMLLAEIMGASSPAEFIGKRDTDFPHLGGLAEGYVADDLEVMRRREPVFNIVEEVRYPDGGIRVVRTNKAPLYDADGDIIGTLGFCRDITEDRKLEAERARLVAALNQSEELVIITDPEGVIEYANQAFERVSGLSSADVFGKDLNVTLSPDHPPEEYRALVDRVTRGEMWQGLLTNRRKDGTFYEVLATISPVRNEEGTIINYVVLERDVTEGRRMEQQIRQAQKMEALGQLAGGVAHDFNNLLQVVSGHIELTLNKVSANAAVAEQLRNAGDAVMRAARLVRQLLIFSRHQDLTRENLDLNVCVQELLKMLRRYIGEHVGILFRPDGSDMRFVGSAVQMEQLIMNLCINARDAMPAGGVITLETARETLSQIPADFPWASPGEYVRLCVRDTGCGMSRETLERVFEPFFSTKEVGKGTGMGLATVYGVVKQHNGVITVESAPGAGTVFCVFLPAGGEVPEKPHTDIEDIFLEDPGGVETILFAEDDPDIRKLGNTFLADAGYRVITAADGEDARRLFADHAEEISLVISDVIMPGLSGGRLHAEITAIRPGVPFLFTSGYSRDELRDTVLPEASGVILRKPYLRGRLLRAVRAVLDHAGPLPDEPDPRIL